MAGNSTGWVSLTSLTEPGSKPGSISFMEEESREWRVVEVENGLLPSFDDHKH
jgi:hypothetical protein